MIRRRSWLAISILAIAVAMFSVSAAAQNPPTMTVTGAGEGSFSAGAIFNGVSLNSLRFGMGVELLGDGISEGGFQSTLVGTTATGVQRNIVIQGEAFNGTVQSTGQPVYSGTCSVDLGNGIPRLNDVPFTLSVARLANGKPTLALTIGTSALPIATINKGTVTVR